MIASEYNISGNLPWFSLKEIFKKKKKFFSDSLARLLRRYIGGETREKRREKL